MARKQQEKPLRPSAVREWQRRRSKEWRGRFYAQGYTYRKIDGHWGWVKKKPRQIRARVHSNDPKEIERLKRRIMEARTK
jgi:hypothetical protein